MALKWKLQICEVLMDSHGYVRAIAARDANKTKQGHVIVGPLGTGEPPIEWSGVTKVHYRDARSNAKAVTRSKGY